MFLQHTLDRAQFLLSRYTLNIQSLLRVPVQNNQMADDPPIPKASSYVNPSRQCPEKAFLIWPCFEWGLDQKPSRGPFRL